MGKRDTIKVLAGGPVIPAPMQQARRHLPTLFGKLAMERWIFFSRSVKDRLKTIASLRASSLIGCMW